MDRKYDLKNDLILRTIRGENTERTPVWLMRQAGRILPEYRQVREEVKDFIELVKTPELASEVTVQPVRILKVDAAIIFSDILVIPEAMGLPYEMVENKGPHFPQQITNEYEIDQLKVENTFERLEYVAEAIKLTKKKLRGEVPLIGFAGAPWTIFCYMVEGGSSKNFSKARGMLYQRPEIAHKLLEKITQSTVNYLKLQIMAGADVVQIFDSWAGILPPQHYRDFAMPYLQKICNNISEVPVTVFAKGAFYALKELGGLNCQTLGLDWQTDPTSVRKLLQEKVLQGNLDPCALYGNERVISSKTKDMLKHFGPHRHIANLGHGVYPDTDPGKVKFFVDAVKRYSRKMRNLTDTH